MLVDENNNVQYLDLVLSLKKLGNSLHTERTQNFQELASRIQSTVLSEAFPFSQTCMPASACRSVKVKLTLVT